MDRYCWFVRSVTLHYLAQSQDAELCVAFVSRGIPARLVDFPCVNNRADAVLHWVERYFTSPSPNCSAVRNTVNAVRATVDEVLLHATPVICTDRMPLVLQHDGHSRTVVGFEKQRNGSINLLVLDPSKFVISGGLSITLIYHSHLPSYILRRYCQENAVKHS